MSAPWYTYNRIDNFGQIDPAGPFWKPDSNIQIPGLYPVTALNSGTVTSIQNTGFGQAVVTVKLDNPFNSLATHEFYEHMSSAAGGLAIGQHVPAGTLIGYNNPTGAAPLGFGFYPGDVYGSGSAWATDQNDLRPGGAGLLNPVAILDSARGGSIPQGSGSGGSSGGSPAAGWVTRLQGEAQKIGLFVLALVLVGFGAYLLFQKQMNNAARKGVQAAKVAAI